MRTATWSWHVRQKWRGSSNDTAAPDASRTTWQVTQRSMRACGSRVPSRAQDERGGGKRGDAER
jgi:hypothetical protein